MFRSCLLACGLFLAASPVQAWWDKGHKIVCEIAWQELKDRTKEAVRDLLRPEGRRFNDSCIWADEIKGDPEWDHVKPHHYINVPPGAEGVDLERDCPADRGCVVSAIETHIATLSAPDDQAGREQKAQALKFLGHFIGDIHQPLHAGFPNDRGGNLIRVNFFGRSTNLHKAWDGEMIDRSGQPWEQMALTLHQEITDSERVTWRGSKAIDWVTESYRLAELRAYREPSGGWDLGQTYVDNNLPEIVEQLKKGGVRLAETLNSIAWASDAADPEIGPDNYYAAAAGLGGEDLREALHEIIGNHKRFTYSQVWDVLRFTDEDPQNADNVILLYTQRSQDKARRDFGSGDNDAWNREHVWPKSHGFKSKGQLAYTDVHHLRPADKTVNSSRGNKDFDAGGGPHGEAAGARADSDSFEPPDGVKGDVARMIFYMAVRYEGGDGVPDLQVSKSTTSTGDPQIGRLCTLVAWHGQDPVSDWEKRRNDRIHQMQENRSPFIDHPEWVEELWGEQCP